MPTKPFHCIGGLHYILSDCTAKRRARRLLLLVVPSRWYPPSCHLISFVWELFLVLHDFFPKGYPSPCLGWNSQDIPQISPSPLFDHRRQIFLSASPDLEASLPSIVTFIVQLSARKRRKDSTLYLNNLDFCLLINSFCFSIKCLDYSSQCKGVKWHSYNVVLTPSLPNDFWYVGNYDLHQKLSGLTVY